ncbi:MAG: hypothetical protein IPM52_10080 [Bacteroidetes bacterium]|nr:hypothetical protein [Bacteroidota bacterium]
MLHYGRLTAGALCFFLMCACSGKYEPDRPIVAGSHKGMKMQGGPVVIHPGGYYNFETIALDANRDGTDDYKFSLGYWGSPGMGMKLHSSFSSLHDGALLFGTTTEDTLFVRTTRTFSFDPGMNMVVAYTLTKHDCMKRSVEYFPASHAPAFHPLWLNEGDLIGGTEDNFRPVAVSFVYSDSWPPSTTIINDTLWVNRSETRNDCRAVPLGQSVFVGLAMIENGKFKRGWIRFRLDGAEKITFEEMAFQR